MTEIQLNNIIIADKGSSVDQEVLTEASNMLHLAHMIVYFINDKFLGLQQETIQPAPSSHVNVVSNSLMIAKAGSRLGKPLYNPKFVGAQIAPKASQPVNNLNAVEIKNRQTQFIKLKVTFTWILFQTANLIVPLKCKTDLKESLLTRCLLIDNTKKSINLNIKLLQEISIKSKSSYQVPFLTTFEDRTVFLYKRKQMSIFGDKMDNYISRVI